ncbi:hypothetical protein PGN57_09425 [Klebsiella aerogenes]
MTDINRLIASLKRRSAHAKEFGDDITFVKLKDIDALVETLEKAQETIAFQQGEIKALLSSLESRTVKLPDALLPATHKSGELFMTPDNVEQGGYLNRDDVLRVLRAAGIKVEVE